MGPMYVTRFTIIALLAAAACQPTELTITAGGDGAFDCLGGPQVESTDINIKADTEFDAARLALEPWLADGGTVTRAPDGALFATVDGRDLAMIVPTQQPDGSWTVPSVMACVEGAEPQAIDGELDCLDDSRWSIVGTPTADAVADPTAEVALRRALRPWTERHGGTIQIDKHGATATLTINGREVIAAHATETTADTWIATTVTGCADYAPDPPQQTD